MPWEVMKEEEEEEEEEEAGNQTPGWLYLYGSNFGLQPWQSRVGTLHRSSLLGEKNVKTLKVSSEIMALTCGCVSSTVHGYDVDLRPLCGRSVSRHPAGTTAGITQSKEFSEKV